MDRIYIEQQLNRNVQYAWKGLMNPRVQLEVRVLKGTM